MVIIARYTSLFFAVFLAELLFGQERYAVADDLMRHGEPAKANLVLRVFHKENSRFVFAKLRSVVVQAGQHPASTWVFSDDVEKPESKSFVLNDLIVDEGSNEILFSLTTELRNSFWPAFVAPMTMFSQIKKTVGIDWGFAKGRPVNVYALITLSGSRLRLDMSAEDKEPSNL